MAENFLRGAARVDFAEGKTAKKPLKSPKNVKKRENFIFLSCSKFSLYFFTPRGIKIKKIEEGRKIGKIPRELYLAMGHSAALYFSTNRYGVYTS